jgi:alkylation response protein AidB-like acyl-CoA dehydrogenase
MQVLGSRGLGWSGDGFESGELARTRRWLITRADSIWGGTSEIQRNIIAKRVLLIPE